MIELLFTLFELLSHAFGYIGYIKTNAFLKPLCKEEEERCIQGLMQKDTTCRNTLIEHNLRLVAHIVKKYDMKKETTEDLISIGTIGLVKGIDSFDATKGHKLTTYISRCIENEILMYLRSSKNYFQTISLNEPIATDQDGSEITLLDALAAPKTRSVEETLTLRGEIQDLYTYLPLLDEREYQIVVQRFGLYGKEKKTQKEIAKQMHISRSYVSRIEKRAFLKLYQAFEEAKEKR